MEEGKKQVLTVMEAADLLGISRNTAYEAVAKGQIPSVKIGKRYLIPVVAFERMLQSAAQ